MNRKMIAIFGVLAGLAVLGLFLCGCSETKKEPKTLIASGHPEWPPIMYQQDDKIVGAGPEIFGKLFKELDVEVVFRYEGTWEEAQKKAKAGSVDVLVAAYKTPERETYMDYSIPYTVDPVVLVVKKGKPFPYEKQEDLVGKKGVVMTGDSYGADFDKFIKDKLTVAAVATPDEAVSMLDKETADYFVYAQYSAEGYIFDKKLSDKLEIISKPVANENFYLTISKKSAYANLMPKINKLLEKYIADGTIDKMIESNKNVLWKQ
jgi:polar amino acid transport system substrate-binding protein